MADLLKKFLLILFIALFPVVNVGAAKDDGVYTYVFHLYFDNGKLLADRDFEVPFELIAEEYGGSGKLNNTFYGEILSVSNKKLADFSLNLPYGSKGKLSQKAPYFDNAKTVNFYNRENIRIFSLDLAPAGPVCNENSVCNSDTGETFLNCSRDCPAPTPSITPSPAATLPSFTNDVFGLPLLIGLVLILVVVLILVFLRRRKNKLPPPQITSQV